MMEPRYRIGQSVVLRGNNTYKILGIEKHGNTICDCCFGAVYFLYQISSIQWVNESELEAAALN